MWARREVLVVLAAASVIIAGGTAVLVANSGPSSGLLPFGSYAELSAFVAGARSGSAYGAVNGTFAALPGNAMAGPVAGSPSAPGGAGTPAYSGTYVQVAGVDELDMVKTDGTYLYLASRGEVDILLAYPAASMRVASRLSVDRLVDEALGQNATASATGLFLDGARLVVVAQTYGCGYGAYCGVPMPLAGAAGPILPAVAPAPERTYAFVVDVSDPASPVLLHTVSITGYPSPGRMVQGTEYLVATEWIQEENGSYVLPELCVDSTSRHLTPGEIYHDPQSPEAWDYTNLLALDVAHGNASALSIVTGDNSLLYMSPSAMYLAFLKWNLAPLGIAAPALVSQSDGGWTTIYKLRAVGLDVSTVGSADVSGWLVGPYAMDEWNGDLRVATTVRTFTEVSSATSSGVSVFDASMHLVGSVGGLAPGESIFAVRFVEDRAYIVTFRKIDPLFVVDLSDPARPAVSGFLEMPGFSDYLYPLGAGHLIGVGKDAVAAAEGNWSWYQGLKLALYNVTSPTRPTETANVTIGDRGTDSEVLWDPHAFLYVPGRDYVVLPVDLAVIDPTQYPGGVPDWAWGTVVWQGVVVYHVNATTGFEEVGRIAHDNGTVNATCGWFGAPNEIRRSLYIGDTLYTISATEVMANALADLSAIVSVVYAPAPPASYGCPVAIA